MQFPETVAAVAIGTDAVATLPAQMYPRKLTRLTINGARSSRAEVYLGAITQSTRFDQTSRGSSNTAEFVSPMDIPVGMTVSVVWPGKAANVAESLATFTTVRA